ncbi:hypothetical protein IEQ34_004620 [Dendrobium chrysotoxum]|uniref:Uncharacterized protein n=1 Tax=Dendrobium chrysotoxum TaxID=161865 RepID=A0AAV7HET1_DENCH|nr:hypothetical protein IEQ34_004620 [Dendrobium chrysotoxum]
MGNCCERSSPELQEVKKEEAPKKEEQSDDCARKLTVVLTKPELDWLMLQLEQKPGKMSLEDLLAQMLEESERKEEERWRPVLESIMEVPEIQSIESSAEMEKFDQPALVF